MQRSSLLAQFDISLASFSIEQREAFGYSIQHCYLECPSLPQELSPIILEAHALPALRLSLRSA